MTANHMRAVWAGAISVGSYGMLEYARRQTKGYPFQSFDDLARHTFATTAPIRPYAFGANLYSADQWGVSFPAGLVHVLTELGSKGTGDFDTRLRAYMDDVVANGSSFGYLVPGVLPSGYTACLQTPWLSQWNLGDAASFLNYVPSASGWTLQEWQPSNAWNGYDTGLITVTFLVLNNAWVSYALSASGFRSLQVRGFVLGGVISGATGGHATFTLTGTHNADGSDPGDADGDTTDWSVSFVDGDWATVGGSIATSWKTISAGALATRGAMTAFKAKVTNTSGFGYPAQLQFRLSPRLDVPFPLTVTGEADLITPGGIP